MRPRSTKKRLLWFSLGLLFLIIAGLAWLTVGFHQDYKSIPSDHLVGNKAHSVEALKEKGLPFSFLVIGDPTGSEAAETLIETSVVNGAPAFMVILGDFVKKPDIWNHRFFLTEMTTEIKPPFPVFLVAGNHDIDYFRSKRRSDERRVTPEVYESLYGPRNFDFVFNNCLFIICGVDPVKPADFISSLRDALFRKSSGKKHIFVFVHYPPKGLARHIPGSMPIPHEEEFFTLLETFKVTTCFFGDYHGYWRGQRKGVNLIVSGGGGRLKHSQPAWGKFHHIIRVTVRENEVSEDLIVLNKETGFMHLEDTFESIVFTEFFPIIEDRVWVLYSSFLLFSILGISSFILSLRKKSLGQRVNNETGSEKIYNEGGRWI